MNPRFLWPLVIAVVLAGCGEPPGTPKPLPLNYQEETKSVEVYRKYQPQLQAVDGVQETFLSSNNNPRRIVVVVRDDAAAQAVRQKFGESLDGIGLNTQVSDREDSLEDGSIQKVPTQELPSTWWGRVLYYLQTLQTRLLGGDAKH